MPVGSSNLESHGTLQSNESVWLSSEEWLYGTEFILETDHQPFQYLRQAKFQNGRLMRWTLTLQPYRFVLRAIHGRDIVAADCLSRNPLSDC